MNKLTKSLLVGLLESESQVVALYGGGFKPPTKGHFEVAQKTLQDHPEIDKFYIIVGSGVRNNITQDESFLIWNIYKKYLSDKVEIVKAQSPLSFIKKYIQDNPEGSIYAVLGTREGNEGDLADFDERKSFLEKYGDNLTVLNIITPDTVSGTKARKAATQSKEEFLNYIPDDLTPEEKNTIWDIVGGIIQENTPIQPSFDYTSHIKSLTKHMISNGLNLIPLPKVKFIDNDHENAKNFFGKTAYYDHNKKLIVLYTLKRHPKDIMRSFAHEMVHHMQNCEGRLQNITTQNTNEEGDLPEIEREAYEKGNMLFRGWTDTITEGVLKETQKKTKYLIFCDMDGVLVNFDKGYEDLTGLHTKHVDVQDNQAFWDKFKSSLTQQNTSEYEYWANLDWEEGGQMLWNYIKPYNPYILTAPSLNPESRLGKKEWTTRLDGMKNIYFRKAKSKSDFSGKNRILIDDREDTIERWNAKGGIGILHNPNDPQATIEKLKELGL